MQEEPGVGPFIFVGEGIAALDTALLQCCEYAT